MTNPIKNNNEYDILNGERFTNNKTNIDNIKGKVWNKKLDIDKSLETSI